MFFAQLSSAGDLKISFGDVAPRDGKLLYNVFKSEEGFPEDITKAIRSAEIDLKSHTPEAIINELPVGDYAVAVIHDLDGDGKLKTNWLGIPKEGFGFSNDVMGFLGPPSFKSSSFKVQKGEQLIKLKLKYY